MATSAMTYSLKGRLTLSRTGWVLLEVPNSIGNGLFQALTEHGIEQPVSQTHGRYNAHVSVIRPEEVEAAGGSSVIKARGQTFGFNLGAVREINAPAGWDEVSKCWVVEVRSPELMTLRRSLGLGEPKYPFHITFAIRKKNALKAASLIHFQKLAAVSTEIKDSSIDGRGLFATRSFKIGDVISDRYMTRSVGDDGRTKFDQSEQCRFTNHSSTANCVIESDGDYIKLVADRDIVKGEELTGDYAECGNVLGPDFDFTYQGKPYDGSSSARPTQRDIHHHPVSDKILDALRCVDSDDVVHGRTAGDRDSTTGADTGDDPRDQHPEASAGDRARATSPETSDNGDARPHHPATSAFSKSGAVRGPEPIIRLADVLPADWATFQHPVRPASLTAVLAGAAHTLDKSAASSDSSIGQDSGNHDEHASRVFQRKSGSAVRDPGEGDGWFLSWARGVLRGEHSTASGVLGAGSCHPGLKLRSAGFAAVDGSLGRQYPGGDAERIRSGVVNDRGVIHGDGQKQSAASGVLSDGSLYRGPELGSEGGLPVNTNRAEKLRTLRTRRGECPGCGATFKEDEPYPDVKMCEVCERFGKPKLIKEGMAIAAQIVQARKDTAEPASEAQAAAGNYAKGKFRMHGLSFAIETPKGGVRSGKDKDGKSWSNTMTADYGYILGTVGSDGDHVDVFIGPDPEAEMVFVVDQIDPTTGKFDEIKVMFGYKTEEAAREGYLSNYSTGWQGLKEITPLTMRQFKWWLQNGDTLKAVAGATIKTAVDSIYGKALVQTPVNYNPQAGILGNVTNHLAAVKARGDRTISEAGAQDRLANAMDPNRASQQLLSLIQGKRQPMVQHPVDRILAGVRA
jgi:hypothetical protein